MIFKMMALMPDSIIMKMQMDLETYVWNEW